MRSIISQVRAMNARRLILVSLLTAMTASSLTGCLAVAAGGTAGYLVATHKNSVGNYASDSTITSKIKAKYLANSHIKSLNLSVSTAHGVVSLSGTVPTHTMKSLAIKIARQTSGVRGVNAGSLDIG